MTRGPRAFTLVEAVISTVIVAVMFAAVMAAVGAARTTAYRSGGGSRGALLALELMSEILPRHYADLQLGLGSMGPETLEISGTRAAFDDIDDYDGWSASPPEDRQGNAAAGLAGWGRKVRVVWVNPDDLEVSASVETKAKRITVTVTHGEAVMAQLVAVRTAAWPEPGG